MGKIKTALTRQLERENKIAIYELEFDKIIEWLTENKTDHPEYEAKVAELHRLEVKMKQLITVPFESTMNGFKEKSINDIKYGRA